MIGTLVALLVFASLVLAVPVLVMFLLVAMSLPRLRVSAPPPGARPRVAVLVPAHDEQLVIGKTLASIAGQIAPADRIVVIADNCTDGTAGIARQHGAEVTIRCDPVLRGKGYALDHGLKFLERTGAPEIVVLIDADCQLGRGCIDRLAHASLRSGRPAQAAYLMTTPKPARKTASMVSFAWKVKDFVRPLGWHRLTLPCQLAGSGMAFPWEVIRAADLAGGHLAEDLKLGLDLAMMGKFAVFCPDAVVTSDVAVGGSPSRSQRARWEHGVIETTMRYLPRLLIRFCKAPSLPLLAVALDLCIPPLALLALMLGADLVLALGFLFAFGAVAPVTVSALVCIFFFAAICLAWWRHGQDIMPFRWLVFAPLYAIMKIPMYGSFFLNRQRAWVRGERQLHG